MARELKLLSPAGAESAIYSWPVLGTDGKDGAEEVLETIRFVCEDFPGLKQGLDPYLEDVDAKSYDCVKNYCDRYNKLLAKHLQQRKAGDQNIKKRASRDLLKHLLQQCYNVAVADPDRLNQYEPFSPEVYGETSFELVDQMVSTIRLREDDIFVDLGSGVGQVVLQVAAAGPCKFCFGIEKAEWPAEYAKNMDTEFKKWMKFYGKEYCNYSLEKGDFLCETFRKKMQNVTVIFVNNFAFGPVVDHQLKVIFGSLNEGARIVSSKAFCPLNFRITDRNLSDIGSIMHVTELSPLCGAVSWTGKPFTYFVHTIDRTMLERYFQRLKNPDMKDTKDLRRDRRGRVITDRNTCCQNHVENGRKKRNSCRIDGKELLDHNYQTAKLLDFDSASNASSLATDDSNIVLGPTTRRQWTEWVLRPKTPTSCTEQENDHTISAKVRKVVKKRTRSCGNSKLMKRNGQMKKSKAAEKKRKALKKMTLNGSKARKLKIKNQALALDGLSLLHTHTVLSTSGQVAKEAARYNDSSMTVTKQSFFKPSTQHQTVSSLETPQALQLLLEMYRQQMMAYITSMSSPQYRSSVQQQVDVAKTKNKELKEAAMKLMREVDTLEKDKDRLLKAKLSDANAVKLMNGQNGFTHKKNGFLQPVVTQDILMKEVSSSYAYKKRLMNLAQGLEEEVASLEKKTLANTFPKAALEKIEPKQDPVQWQAEPDLIAQLKNAAPVLAREFSPKSAPCDVLNAKVAGAPKNQECLPKQPDVTIRGLLEQTKAERIDSRGPVKSGGLPLSGQNGYINFLPVSNGSNSRSQPSLKPCLPLGVQKVSSVMSPDAENKIKMTLAKDLLNLSESGFGFRFGAKPAGGFTSWEAGAPNGTEKQLTKSGSRSVSLIAQALASKDMPTTLSSPVVLTPGSVAVEKGISAVSNGMSLSLGNCHLQSSTTNSVTPCNNTMQAIVRRKYCVSSNSFTPSSGASSLVTNMVARTSVPAIRVNPTLPISSPVIDGFIQTTPQTSDGRMKAAVDILQTAASVKAGVLANNALVCPSISQSLAEKGISISSVPTPTVFPSSSVQPRASAIQPQHHSTPVTMQHHQISLVHSQGASWGGADSSSQGKDILPSGGGPPTIAFVTKSTNNRGSRRTVMPRNSLPGQNHLLSSTPQAMYQQLSSNPMVSQGLGVMTAAPGTVVVSASAGPQLAVQQASPSPTVGQPKVSK